jgi:hypothetical protein
LLSSQEFVSFTKAMKGVDFSKEKMVDGKITDVHYFKGDGLSGSSGKPYFEGGTKPHYDLNPTKYDLDIPSYESILKDKSTLIGEYDLYKIGMLGEKYAETLAGYKYKSYGLKDDIIVYRAGSKEFEFGDYCSFENPISELQVRMDKAIMHTWPDGYKSVIDTVYAIKIPKGNNIYVGDISTQGNLYFGGTEQIIIPKSYLIKGIEVIKSYPIKKGE